MGVKGEKGRWGVTLIQTTYVGWIWEFLLRREEGVMADTAMRPHTLERKQESHSEGQKNLTLEYVLGVLQNQIEPWES